jgi:hypothetical protein
MGMVIAGLETGKKDSKADSKLVTKRTKGTVLSAKDNGDGSCTLVIKYATDDSGNPAAYQSNGPKKSMLLANINGTLTVQGHDVKIRGNLLI